MSTSFKTLPQTCLVFSLSVTSGLKVRRLRDRNTLNIHNAPLQMWFKASRSLTSTGPSILHSSFLAPFPLFFPFLAVVSFNINFTQQWASLISAQSLAQMFPFLPYLKFLWHVPLGAAHSCSKHQFPLASDITPTWPFFSLSP